MSFLTEFFDYKINAKSVILSLLVKISIIVKLFFFLSLSLSGSDNVQKKKVKKLYGDVLEREAVFSLPANIDSYPFSKFANQSFRVRVFFIKYSFLKIFQRKVKLESKNL